MKAFKDSIYMIFGKSIKTFGNLLFTMVISRVISTQELGTYKQIITISTLLFTIVPLGIPISISYYYNTFDKKNKSNLITNSNMFLIISGGLSVVVLYLLKNFINIIFNNTNLSLNITGLAIYTFSMILSSSIENSFISKGDSQYISKFNTFYYIIYYIISIIFILKIKNINIILISMGVMEIFRCIYLNYILYKSEKLKIIINKKSFYKQFIFCLPLGLSAIIQNVNTELDKIFISMKYTPIETAIYSNGSMNIPFIGIISITVASVTLPIMVREYRKNGFEKVLEIWNNSSLVVFIILTSIFFGLYNYAEGYIEFVFSKQYLQSTQVFIIYLLKLPLSFTVFGNILVILRKQKATLYNMILAVFMNCILNYIFINSIGLNGPAIASVLIHIFLIVLQLIQISNASNTRIIKLLPYKEMGKSFVLIFVISKIIKIISNRFNFNNIINLFIFGGLTVFLSLLILLIINKDRVRNLIAKES